jgi:methionine aminopeptidase
LIVKTGEQFKRDQRMRKGIAFPTCLSINNCVANFSPLKDGDVTLSKGDVVKMYLKIF